MRFSKRWLLAMGMFTCVGNAWCQSNLVLFVSQPGDPVGGGHTYATMDPNSFSLSGSPATFTINAFGFGFNFSGPGGTNLVVGSYPNTARWPFNGSQPGLDISGNGVGCNTECGSFDVLELHTNAGAQVDRLWVTFSNRCECGMSPMTGEIRFHSQLAPPTPVPKTIHVPADYTNIQWALNAASPLVPDTVLVDPGTYYENLNFNGKAVILLSASGPAVTIIDGNRLGAVITCMSGEGAGSVINGFTLQNGYSSYGSGFATWGSSPTIVSNIFQNNEQQDGYFGAAISGNNSSPIIEENLFRNNSGDAQFLSGVVSFVNDSSPVIANNIFVNNPCRAINLTLPEGNTPVVINNTIVSNSVGIRVDARVSTATHWYLNNLLFGNTVGLEADFGVANFANWAYNLVAGGQNYLGISDQTGTNGNLATNPQFTCLPGGDFHLLAESPCIDAGTNGMPQLPVVDFDGHPRILPGKANVPAKVDIGAFEFNPAFPPVPCLYLTPPSNVVAIAAPGQSSTAVNYPQPDATPTATVTCSPASGSIFPAGTNLVTCTLVYGTHVLTGTFTVTVLVPAYISSQPSAITVLANSATNLSVSALGTLPMSYQWSFGGNAIAGATDSSLIIFNAQSADEGYYQVTLINSISTATSAPILLRVLPAAAEVVSGPSPVTVSAGNTAVFAPTVVGSAPLLVQWYKNQALLPGANSARLVIPNAQEADIGTYQVAVSNFLGSGVSPGATLTVVPAKPAFVVQPASTAVVAGTNFSFQAMAIGTDNGLDPIRYSWYFQGTNLLGENSSILTFSSVTAGNEGDYFAVATNSFGAVTSAVAHLTVYLPPAISGGLSNQIVDAGNTIILGVGVAGTPPLVYSWFFNGILLASTNANLVITNIRTSQSGNYSVQVSNMFGLVSSAARVSVFLPPSTVLAWGDNSSGQRSVPTNLNDAVAIAGGDYHSLAIRHDGTLVGWGDDSDAQVDMPTNSVPFVSIAAGASHNLAITEDGGVVAWGNNDFGQCDVPAMASNMALAVAAGKSHSLALLGFGQVVAWGDNTYGQTALPLSLTPGGHWQLIGLAWVWVDGPVPVKAIAAGRNHNLAAFYDGTVTAWGDNAFGQSSPPANLSNVVALAAGYLHSVALCVDGSVVVWGDNSFGQTNVPAGLSNVVAIAAGDFHTLALQANGSVVGWGNDSYGQTEIPSVVVNPQAIASGYYHGLALVSVRPTLSAYLAREGMVLSWNLSASLECGPTPLGPFTNVPCQGLSYTNRDLTAPAKFFRLRP